MRKKAKPNLSKGIQYVSVAWDVFIQHLQEREVQGADGEDKYGIVQLFTTQIYKGDNNSLVSNSGRNSCRVHYIGK